MNLTMTGRNRSVPEARMQIDTCLVRIFVRNTTVSVVVVVLIVVSKVEERETGKCGIVESGSAIVTR